MKKSPDPFKGKHVLVVSSGADSVVAATWLLDREVQVTITDPTGIRGIQGHLRATATDGSEYERRKNRLMCVAPEEAGATLQTADLVVARAGSEHAILELARERGIQVVSRGELSNAFPLPPRQEVHHAGKLTIINDTGAVSPERGIVSVRQWGGPNCVLIAGGDLPAGRQVVGGDYHVWADAVAESIRPTNTIFLTGSATDKMRAALGRSRGRGIRTYETLDRCLKVARERANKYISAVILFSPAAKSFELFDNEFDRGQQFNALVKRSLS